MMQRWLDWAARIVAAIILLQTLFFKLTGAPESVYIFSSLGAEPWGRYGSGLVELVAALLLLVPRTAWLGAGIGLGVMVGAIASHVLVLGIEVQGDGGMLFGLAIVVLVCCAMALWTHRADVPIVSRRERA
jgi:uncharacterized membrane protein YphA (DoxX/SURF4 family)